MESLLSEPAENACADSPFDDAHAPMLVGDTTVSLCNVIVSDPVHVAYISAGGYVAVVWADGCSVLSCLWS